MSSSGYYYCKIHYQQKDSTKGFVMEWRSTGQFEVIPAEEIFHLALGMLSYVYEQAHYSLAVNTVEKKLRLFSIEFCNNYQIAPALPNGLTLNVVSGAITGTPTAEQVLIQYTVTIGVCI